jgi:prepilin-type N-terminal cleavage/methylation domain-containing protein
MSPRSTMVRSEKGFTLTEMIVVVAIISILAALSTPSLLQFRKNLQCRQAAMSIVSTLRQAKSQAITTNLEQQVSFDTHNEWAIQSGDRPYSSANWTPNPITVWIQAPTSVTVTPAQNIQFVPNGTAMANGAAIASGTTVTINTIDQAGVTRFAVLVEGTGRISVKQQY